MPVCPKGHNSADSDYCSECGARMAGAPGITAVQSSPPPPGASEQCPDCGTPRVGSAVFCEVCRYNFATRASFSPSAGAPGGAAPPIQPLDAGAQLLPPPDVSAQPLAPPDAAAQPLTPLDSASIFGAAAGATLTQPDTLTAPPATGVDITAPELKPAPAAASVAGSAPPSGSAPARWEIVVATDPSLYTDPDPGVSCPADEPDRVFQLEMPDNLVGRTSVTRDIHPEIPLTDTGVSHRHAKFIRQADSSFVLRDVGSTNGTTLNGKLVEPGVDTPVKDGDQITLGCWSRITIRAVPGAL